MHSEYSLICHNSFSKNMEDNESDRLSHSNIYIHWYLYLIILLVLGNCGGLEDLTDKAVTD